MHIQVTRKSAQNRSDFTIAVIVIVLIGLGLFQATSMPGFDEFDPAWKATDPVSRDAPVTFVEERHFEVARGETLTFVLRTAPHRRVDYFLVHPDPKVPILHQESSGTDADGLTVYSGQVNDRILSGITYYVGVQVTLPNKGEKVLVLAPYTVSLISE